MEEKITTIESNIQKIQTYYIWVTDNFELLKHKIDELKNLYVSLVNANLNSDFIFSLDSFNFQGKLLDIEYNDMAELFIVIKNKMYGEYYKLNKIILQYIIKENIKILENINYKQFPTYNDVELLKEYTSDSIIEIQENIQVLIKIILSFISYKESELHSHIQKQNNGYKINNFVSTCRYQISIFQEKVNLFISYTEYFNKLHINYLKRFISKINMTLVDIDVFECPKKYMDNANVNANDDNDNDNNCNHNNDNDNSDNNDETSTLSLYTSASSNDDKSVEEEYEKRVKEDNQSVNYDDHHIKEDNQIVKEKRQDDKEDNENIQEDNQSIKEDSQSVKSIAVSLSKYYKGDLKTINYKNEMLQ